MSEVVKTNIGRGLVSAHTCLFSFYVDRALWNSRRIPEGKKKKKSAASAPNNYLYSSERRVRCNRCVSIDRPTDWPTRSHYHVFCCVTGDAVQHYGRPCVEVRSDRHTRYHVLGRLLDRFASGARVHARVRTAVGIRWHRHVRSSGSKFFFFSSMLSDFVGFSLLFFFGIIFASSFIFLFLYFFIYLYHVLCCFELPIGVLEFVFFFGAGRGGGCSQKTALSPR